MSSSFIGFTPEQVAALPTTDFAKRSAAKISPTTAALFSAARIAALAPDALAAMPAAKFGAMRVG